MLQSTPVELLLSFLEPAREGGEREERRRKTELLSVCVCGN